MQLVWKDSERVGFGVATGSDGMTRVVANYQPCGNMNFNSPSGAATNVDMADSKLPTDFYGLMNELEGETN